MLHNLKRLDKINYKQKLCFEQLCVTTRNNNAENKYNESSRIESLIDTSCFATKKINKVEANGNVRVNLNNHAMVYFSISTTYMFANHVC